MNVGFNYEEPGKPEKIYFEQVFAEKPGGALVANPGYDIEPSTALGYNSDGKLAPIKAFRLVAAVGTEDTTIKIAKGSGVAVGDIIATGKKGVACTAVVHGDEYDTVTVTMGVAIAKDKVLYQAAGASANAAVPKYTPSFVAGVYVYAGKGDQLVKVVNGANLRKETACVSSEVAALLPAINLV